jgi:membrane protein DedA with SNARE-associated domain
MNYLTFSAFTLLGAAIWCSVLCWLGVKIGADITKGEMHKVIFSIGGTALCLADFIISSFTGT